jgi:chitin disaccharide deacetylase
MEKRRAIITRGDDCGSTHAANIGIMEATKAGLLKNISVMAPCPFVQEAAEMFAGLTECCFGLHITLNAEWDRVKWGPVLSAKQVPSLVDAQGMLVSSPALYRQHAPRGEEIMMEVQAQLEKARGLGFDIRYIDTHMGITRSIEGLEGQLQTWAAREGLLYYGYYAHRFPQWDATSDELNGFIATLEALPAGQYLLVTHPTMDVPEVRTLGNENETGEQIAARRSMDIRLLTDPRVVACFERRGIVPLRFDQAERVEV